MHCSPLLNIRNSQLIYFHRQGKNRYALRQHRELQAPDAYQFFKLLNVLIFGVTGVFGVKFLYEGMQLLSEQDEVGKKTRTTILRCWLFLYAFVGMQLGWFLRPFFGAPGYKFELFRAVGGNFYLDIVKAISEILGAR